MLKNTSATPCFQNLSRSSLAYLRKFCSQGLLLAEADHVSGITNLSDSLEAKSKAMQQQQLHTSKASIYRVPTKLRKTDSEAYDPHFISIGPFHRHLPHLQDSEKLKWDSLNRVVGLGVQARDQRDNMLSVLEAVEPQARGCYSEDVQMSRDEFIEMTLLDGCFIVELFRDLEQNNFAFSSLLSKRWMLPVVRRDLITLENQLPMVVLQKIFEETMRLKSNSVEETSLVELALRFFDPLMPREEVLLKRSIKSVARATLQQNFHHLLDVFHSSISLEKVDQRKKEPHMYRSVTKLREAGIKVRVLKDSQPLDLKFNRGVLRIPSLQIDNHTGSFLRNILAYEQCHQVHDKCKPYMTAYLFFLDKLINSAEDVGLLHYEGVIQHTLGSNKQVAKLVNTLCIEVEYDGQDSYLCEVIQSLNDYSDHWLVQVKTRLKHDYFSNIWVSISTLAALVLIYLTLLQTSCGVIDVKDENLQRIKGWWVSLTLFLLHPVDGFKNLASFIVRFIDPEDPTLDDPMIMVLSLCLDIF